MAVYTTVQLNTVSGRYEYHFVNQQYDYVMGICFNEKTQRYEFDCSEEEARQRWGRDDFDAKTFLKEAEEAIKAREKK